MKLRFGSVCSGIEAASVAWNTLGWEAAWFSEIELIARLEKDAIESRKQNQKKITLKNGMSKPSQIRQRGGNGQSV